MTQQTRTVLKSYFNTGDTPTESQFADLIDSSPNKTDDGVPKILRIKMNQSGTDDPVVNVLHNDFAPVTFTYTRVGVGDYRITASAAAFTVNKTYVAGGYVDADNSRFSRAFESSTTLIVISNFSTSAFPPQNLADTMVNQYFEVIVYP